MESNRFSAQLSSWLAILMTCSVAAASFLSPVDGMAFVSEEMSHESASKLLKSHEMFSTVQTIKLNTGTIRASKSEVERYQPKYTTFKAMGLIELTSIRIESPDKDAHQSVEGTRVSLTTKGLVESKAWKHERENQWGIAIATRKLIEVIKIHKDRAERIHGIEFSWTWAPNKTGEALKFTYPAERAYAKLKLQENGWRIVEIRAL